MTPGQVNRLKRLADLAGVVWFDWQERAFQHVYDMFDTWQQGRWPRLCLYYPTGKGKTITALTAMNILGQNNVLVIAPPSTHKEWREAAGKLGMGIDCMSHAKFRMPGGARMERKQAVIADEMHLFGGHNGKGWMKLDRLARGLEAPLILASATPNYNDAERVYCIQHILDPHSCKGGYLQFLYEHCTTEQNPFGMMPNVTGFKNYKNAEEYLAALPDVIYLPDELVYTIDDFPIAEKIPPEMEEFGLDPRRERMIASGIEEKHARVFHSLIDDDGYIQDDVYDFITESLALATGPLLVYCDHSTVAEALARTLVGEDYGLVTGSTSAKRKQEVLDQFRAGKLKLLIGTATLATGTDGLDKVCDELIIVDDTEDDSLRRQLIGRIMPRGTAPSTAHKTVHRLVLQ